MDSDTNSEDDENSEFEFLLYIHVFFYLETIPSNASSDVEVDSDTNSEDDENSEFEFLLYIHVFFLLRINS